jgi:hypothetical protein
LARWEGFPVDREPRPVVLTEFSAPEHDAISRDPRWQAVFDGPAVPESELPPELRSAAADFCRDVHTGEQRPLARIVRGDGPFATDRGIQELPAWMMFPGDRRWPFVALDPGFRRRHTWWPEGLRLAYHGRQSTLAADGRTLTYRFIGTPAGYAKIPRADVFETGTAVLVRPVVVKRDSRGRMWTDHLETREVVVRLDAPLGNRVLVWQAHGAGRDTCGTPCAVVTES